MFHNYTECQVYVDSCPFGFWYASEASPDKGVLLGSIIHENSSMFVKVQLVSFVGAFLIWDEVFSQLFAAEPHYNLIRVGNEKT